MTIQEKIQNNKTYLGIEFGSTRIKAVLIDDTFAPIASGSHDWQNRYENGRVDLLPRRHHHRDFSTATQALWRTSRANTA